MFFDPSTPSMRKVDNGKIKGGGVKKENNVVTNQLPKRLPTGTVKVFCGRYQKKLKKKFFYLKLLKLGKF